MIAIHDDWEFNVLGIYNYLRPGRFDALLKFIRENHSSLEGDIVEAGSYRGNSLIAIGMLLKSLGSDKTVYGFDSFSGFPPVFHENDQFSQFETMYQEARISKKHINDVRKNREWKDALASSQGESQSAETISTSGNFSNTSLELIRRKINLAGLDNIILVDGPFSQTMTLSQEPELIMAAVIDCDLYQSYLEAFGFIWPRLSIGGMIHLDEYYSLKFPGGRLATDGFISDKHARLEKGAQQTSDFERWCVVKES